MKTSPLAGIWQPKSFQILLRSQSGFSDYQIAAVVDTGTHYVLIERHYRIAGADHQPRGDAVPATFA